MEVLKAINAVQAALVMTGIGKDRKNQAQGYSFRGIDDMYNTIAPLLARAKLVVLPSYSDRQVVERRTDKDKALFYVTLRGDFTFRSVEDDSEVRVSTYGEAMDSGDKATNKAMSAALKYAFMQTFTIPTEGDNDSENQTHEVAARIANHGASRPGDGAGKITPASGMFESLPIDMQNHLMDARHRIESLYRKKDVAGAFDEWSSLAHGLDEIQRAAGWSLLDSDIRSGLKKEGSFRDEKKAAA